MTTNPWPSANKPFYRSCTVLSMCTKTMSIDIQASLHMLLFLACVLKQCPSLYKPFHISSTVLSMWTKTNQCPSTTHKPFYTLVCMYTKTNQNNQLLAYFIFHFLSFYLNIKVHHRTVHQFPGSKHWEFLLRLRFPCNVVLPQRLNTQWGPFFHMHIFKHLASIHRSMVDATPEVKSTVALSHDIIWYDVAKLPWYIAHIIENWVASLKTKEHNVVIYIYIYIHTENCSH